MTFLLMVAALFALLILGVPIAVSLMVSGLVGYMITIDVQPGLTALSQIAFSDLNTFVISAIPLYIFMGQLMLKGGSGRDLFNFAQRFVGRLPGGVGVAAIFACAIFAAISGSSTATAATIGSISIPEMLKRGYSRKMTAGSVAVAGSLGILIPPSISFILYSLVTSTSVQSCSWRVFCRASFWRCFSPPTRSSNAYGKSGPTVRASTTAPMCRRSIGGRSVITQPLPGGIFMLAGFVGWPGKA